MFARLGFVAKVSVLVVQGAASPPILKKRWQDRYFAFLAKQEPDGLPNQVLAAVETAKVSEHEVHRL